MFPRRGRASEPASTLDVYWFWHATATGIGKHWGFIVGDTMFENSNAAGEPTGSPFEWHCYPVKHFSYEVYNDAFLYNCLGEVRKGLDTFGIFKLGSTTRTVNDVKKKCNAVAKHRTYATTPLTVRPPQHRQLKMPTKKWQLKHTII